MTKLLYQRTLNKITMSLTCQKHINVTCMNIFFKKKEPHLDKISSLHYYFVMKLN